MKIMLIARNNVFANIYGLEKVFNNMAEKLDQRNYEVLKVGFNDKMTDESFMDSDMKCFSLGEKMNSIEKLKFRINCLLYFNKSNRHMFRQRFRESYISSKIKKVIENNRPDLIISYQPVITYLIYKYCKIDYIPVISMIHGDIDCDELELIHNKEWLEMLKYSSCIQVLMPSFINKLKKYIRYENIVCIPNVVPSYEGFNINYRNKLIMNVGRIKRDVKRQHLLIEAFNLIKEKYVDWQIEFWGSGDTEYLNYCKSLVEKYDLQKQIKFCGTTNKIEQELSRASIFAFPSAYEGFSLALSEAMSMGLPAIGYKNASGVNELIKDNYSGYLIDDGIAPLAETLDNLMCNEQRRKVFGQNAKTDMKQYSEDIIWNQWDELIRKTICTFNSTNN